MKPSGGILLTVVIPHYGDAAPTRALVAQLLPQLEEASAEIVVVDDASPQPLGEVEGARVVRRDRNGGFGSAVNTGLEIAEGDLVAILNSDLIVAEDFLRSFVEAAQPWLPAVAAPRVVTRGHDGATTFRFPTVRTVLAQRVGVLANRRDRRWVSDLIGEDKPMRPGEVHLADWVSGAAMLIPADALHEVGGFDERFHMYLEEVDLQRRLRARGLPAVYLGDVVVEHIGFGSSDPSMRERWQMESWLRYADKWGWRRRLWLAVEVSSAANLVTETARRALGRDAMPVRDWRRRRLLTRSVWRDQARREL